MTKSKEFRQKNFKINTTREMNEIKIMRSLHKFPFRADGF